MSQRHNLFSLLNTLAPRVDKAKWEEGGEGEGEDEEKMAEEGQEGGRKGGGRGR